MMMQKSAGLAWLLAGLAAIAEEGGSGHYTPGSVASFLDRTPIVPSLIVRYNGVFFQSSYSPPVPGVARLEASRLGSSLTLAWRPDVTPAPGLAYGCSVTVPYVWAEVSGDFTAGAAPAHRTSRADGLGDIILIPALLDYTVTRELHLDLRCLVYAPTGAYEADRLANPGKNFWTFSPMLGLLYWGQQNGVEASVFGGLDFNTENSATDYRSGTQFHLDGTLAQHFRALGGLAGVGATGFWYEQLTGDSGAGARLGPAEGYVVGAGPVLSYMRNVAGKNLIVELKWLHELEGNHRLEGDYLWLKCLLRF